MQAVIQLSWAAGSRQVCSNKQIEYVHTNSYRFAILEILFEDFGISELNFILFDIRFKFYAFLPLLLESAFGLSCFKVRMYKIVLRHMENLLLILMMMRFISLT